MPQIHAMLTVSGRYMKSQIAGQLIAIRCRPVVAVVSGLTRTAVFALATPNSPIDRGGRWQLQHFIYTAFFYFSVLLSDTHQGRVWNQTTQPELVPKPWQRQELNPGPPVFNLLSSRPAGCGDTQKWLAVAVQERHVAQLHHGRKH
jgi:hypothetical protein